MIDSEDTPTYPYKNKKYFYKDEEGKLKKYIYCIRCQKGPFELTEQYKNFINISGVNYCIKCIKELNIKLDSAFYSDEVVKVIKPKEKEMEYHEYVNVKEYYIYIAKGTSGMYYAGVSVDPERTEKFSNSYKSYKQANKAGLPIQVLWYKKIGTRTKANEELSLYKFKSQTSLKLIALRKKS